MKAGLVDGSRLGGWAGQVNGVETDGGRRGAARVGGYKSGGGKGKPVAQRSAIPPSIDPSLQIPPPLSPLPS